jgi:serine/threonine-protein kinase HipA
MISRLFVTHDGRRVGVLETIEGEVRFVYDEAWVDLRDSFPLSASLPIQKQPHTKSAAAFFSNLLPEAETRRLLCARLGISNDNDFELLAAIGGECAGALSVSAEPTGEDPSGYRELSRKDLEAFEANHVLSAIDGRKRVRLSLAGAQDKLPVRIEGTDILLPLGNSASTHILKFRNSRFKHLPSNEVFIMMVARALGLPVVDAELWPLGKEGVCVVARYDRVRMSSGEIQRVHQEDMCQALGLPPLRKYENEGGPSFKDCLGVVQAVSADPITDVRNAIRWLAFNVVVFNADAHAKNLSLLYGRTARLAPLYDLICTRAYDKLERNLAMKVGGEGDPTHVRRAHWEALARDCKVGVALVVDLVRTVVEAFPEALKSATAEFKGKYGEKPAIQLVVPKVRGQAKKILQTVG